MHNLGRPKKSDEAEQVTETATRRTLLKQTGAVVGTAALGSLAGCTGGSGDGTELETLSIAYKPTLPFLQYHVMDQQGYFDDLETQVSTTNFANEGATLVTAYADGDIDLAFMGITPAIQIEQRGIPGSVTAANQQNGFVVLGSEEFATLWAEHGADAFRHFQRQKGRRFRFGTLPRSSVSYVLLEYWLTQELGIAADTVKRKPMAGVGPVQRSLVTGNVDGAIISEPIPTALRLRDAPVEQITWAGAFMTGQPSSIVFMHDRLWKDNPALARSILDKHRQATTLINEQPETAARAASDALGENLSLRVARQALQSKASNYISDPRKMMESTTTLIEQMKRLDQIESTVSTEQLFEPSLYRDISA